MTFPIRGLWLALVPAALSLGLAPGCQRQLEGERCALANGNADCEGTGLYCTPASQLGNDEEVPADRCCPAPSESYSDARCAPRVGSGNEGGAGGADNGTGGSSAATGGSGGAPLVGAGDSCDYTSECTPPLVCGPRGICQVECKTDEDCPSGESCVDQSCK